MARTQPRLNQEVMRREAGGAAAPNPRERLGQILVDHRVITPDQLIKALSLQSRYDASLGEILISQGWSAQEALNDALARQGQIARRGLDGQPIDPQLLRAANWRDWLRWEALPLEVRDKRLVVAITRPDRD